MEKDILTIVDEAIALELNVAELYLRFHHQFPDDAMFWWQLAVEEKNHAALLRSGRECLIVKAGLFPSGIVSSALSPLVEANKSLAILLAETKERIPSREEAFRLAIRLEESAGEIHFETFMKMTPKTTAEQMFQSLNQDDKDHARRLREYAQGKGICQEES